MNQTLVHHFRMGDVEDPEIYAAQGLIEFERSEKGAWIMQHATEAPTFYIRTDMDNFGYRVEIKACLEQEALLYFALRWS